MIALAVIGTAQASDIRESGNVAGQIQEQQQNMRDTKQGIDQDQRDFLAIVRKLRVEKSPEKREALLAQKKEIQERQQLHQQKARAEVEKMKQLTEQTKVKEQPQQSYVQMFVEKVKSAFNWVRSIVPNPFS